MPRDNAGNVFGHGSKMKDKKGNIITVAGFATVASGRIDIGHLPFVFGEQFKYYRWTELENVDTTEKSLAGLDTTDHCNVDRAQKAGLNAQDSGDKVIWGS